MDTRTIKRINMKFGKFLDPILLLMVIAIFSISITAVINLSPNTYSKQKNNVLGVTNDTQALHLKPIYGKHQYITDESFEQLSATHFKYTTFVKRNMQDRISKPILQIEKYQPETYMQVQLIYANSSTSQISVVESKTNYILKRQNLNYTQRIVPTERTSEIYLLVQNTLPVLFDQYIEIHFFIEQ